jgi:hypothetical protein
MTKPKAATFSTEVLGPAAAVTPAAAAPEAPPAEVKVEIRADYITISDLAFKAYPAAVALIRTGWNISTEFPPTTFENTGYATITLDRKKIQPEITELAYKIAEQEESLATARAAIDYERRVQDAAKAIIEADKKAAKAAELASEIAAQRAALQALEQAAAAA